MSERYVPPEGDPSSKLAFVGEAPGRVEVAKLRPFVGPAGGVFDQCLHAASIPRSDTYITNLIKYQIHSIGEYYDERRKTLTAKGAQWQEDILEELKSCRANVIVSMGAPATLALTGKCGITKYRGSILQLLNDPARKVIPTIHPAMTLRGTKKISQSLEGRKATSPYISRYFITHDFQRAKKEAATPEFPPTHPVHNNRNLVISPSIEEIKQTMRQLQEERRLTAVDIEVVQFQVSHIAFCNDPFSEDKHTSWAISIPLGSDRWTPDEEVEIWNAIARFLEDEQCPKIFQNGAFDMFMLAFKNKIVVRGPLEDSMVAHHVIYPDFPAGLDFLCSSYTNEPYYKDEGKVWKTGIFDPVSFGQYNARDAATTLEAFNAFRHLIDAHGYRWTYDLHMRMTGPALFMMVHGIRVDKPRLAELNQELQVKLAAKEAELQEEVGRELNYNSPKQCAEYFYGELGIQPYTKSRQTVSGRVSSPTTDDKAMARLARGTASRKPLRSAKLVQELRGLSKLRGTYTNMSFDDDNRFRCQINLRGTTTGRISTGKTLWGTGMNTQNLPEVFKKLLIADPGHLLLSFDKVQAEWVASAYLFGDERMIQVVEEGRDPHLATASMMTNIPEEIIKEEAKAVGHSTDPEFIASARREHPAWRDFLSSAKFVPRNMSIRQMGKKSNHGLNYDEGYVTFSLYNEIPEYFAKQMINAYHYIYPGIRVGHKRIQTELRNDRTLVNPYGRRRKFLDKWGDSLFKEAYAFLPQSTVVDNIDLGMCEIYESTEPKLKPLRLLAQVHDELLYEYPVDSVEDIIYVSTFIMNCLNQPLHYRGRDFIIETDMKIGYSWGDMTELDRFSIADGICAYMETHRCPGISATG